MPLAARTRKPPAALSASRAATLALVMLVLALAPGLLWGLVTAAASPSPSPSRDAKITLRLGWTREPDSLDPFLGYSAPCYEVWHLQYDLLNGHDSATLQPRPEFAESWSHSPDGLTWTFKIRPGMRWQDGRAATAHDVAFTFNYVIKNRMTSFTGYTEGIEKAEAIDDSTVVFTCSRPKSNMLGMWVPILPEHIWRHVDPEDAATDYGNDPPIIGSGPFQVVEWKRGSHLRLVANPDYWAGEPRVDEVILETYQNSDAMVQDLRNGLLAGAWGIPPAQVADLNGPGISSVSYTTIGFDHLTFNCAPAPATGNPVLRDPAFRRALNYAIDKRKIAAVAYSGQVSPATSIIPSGLYAAGPDYHWQPSSADQYTFDLEKAKGALAAAGYRDGDGDGILETKDGEPIELSLLARQESITGQQSGRFIAGWFKQIGLDVRFEVLSEAALSAKVWNTVDGKVQPDYDMFLSGWTGDVDPNFLVSIFTSDQVGMWNRSAWSNAEYDHLFQRQTHQLDPRKRMHTIWKMQRIVYDESPLIPLVYARWQEAYDTRDWTGWVKSPAEEGGVFFTFMTDSYLSVHPSATGSAATSSVPPWKLVGAAAIAASLVVAALLIRHRNRAVDEA